MGGTNSLSPPAALLKGLLGERATGCWELQLNGLGKSEAERQDSGWLVTHMSAPLWGAQTRILIEGYQEANKNTSRETGGEFPTCKALGGGGGVDPR